MSPDTLVVRDGEPAELEVRGVGFDADSNTVVLGPVTLYGVRSLEGGTVLRFIVPDRVTRPGGSPPELWIAGAYSLMVETTHGRSAPVSIVIRDRR